MLVSMTVTDVEADSGFIPIPVVSSLASDADRKLVAEVPTLVMLPRYI